MEENVLYPAPEEDSAAASAAKGPNLVGSPPPETEPAGSLLLFAAAGVMLSAGLILLAPLLPGEFRKLLLFPAAVAAAEGWLLASAAAAAGIHQPFLRRRMLHGLALLLVLLTCGGVQLRVCSSWQAAHPATVEAERIRQLTGEVAGSREVPAEVRRHFAEAAGQNSLDEVSFSGWLRHRVSRLGDWSVAAAATFFAFEIGLALLVGMWVFRSQLPGGSPQRPAAVSDGN